MTVNSVWLIAIAFGSRPARRASSRTNFTFARKLASVSFATSAIAM